MLKPAGGEKGIKYNETNSREFMGGKNTFEACHFIPILLCCSP